MAKVGKKMKAALATYERDKLHGISDAVSIVKKVASANFDETVDIAIKVNLKKGQTLRDTMTLPHQTETEKKILVFARGEKADEATSAGATYVGDAEYIEKIKGGWMDFDVVIATPDMMKEVGKLGPILGRRGLMPNPKTKTVTMDIAGAVNELKQGRIEIRADKTGVVHVSTGKVSMTEQELIDNVKAVMKEVVTKKPSDTKGDFVLSVALSSTMGPGVKILSSEI